MTAIGTDCDIVLFNPGVDAGAGIGCLLDRNRIARGGVNVFRAAYKQADGSYQDSQVVTFTVLLGDSLTNPDGSVHSLEGLRNTGACSQSSTGAVRSV